MLRSIIFIIAVIACLSCQTEIEIEAALSKPLYVANALFNTDSVWIVRLSKSRNILERRNSYENVTNAKITIRDESDNIVETISYSPSSPGKYIGKTYPLISHKYRLQIDIEDFGQIRGENKIPEEVKIISLEVDSTAFKSGQNHIDVTLTFEDPKDVENYYVVRTLNMIANRGFEAIPMAATDPLWNNDYSDSRSIVFRDNFFNGNKYELHFRISKSGYAAQNQPYRVILQNVSKEYYLYFTTKNLQENTKLDYFAQPTQVYTNLENGVGIFAGYSASEFELK